MRHGLTFRKLNRDSSGRRALLRGLATQLIEHGRIQTTLEKAKELRRVVEPLVALARADNYNNRVKAAADLYGQKALSRLFGQIGPQFGERPGGYTRIYKLGHRPGDNAKVAIIEFVEQIAQKSE